MAEKDERGQREPEFPATRTSRALWALVAGLVLLALIIVFMAQNGAHVDVKFLWIKGNLALGVALFGAAILGAATVLLLGAARILQLRRQAKRARQSTPE
jgi:uncharacterized integral membrane protein